MKHGMLLQLALLISLSLAGGSAPTSMHLRFYMHDLATAYPGAPATAVHVAGPMPAAPTTGPAFGFGDMYVIDDPLTEGPDLASPVVGHAQGFYLVASQKGTALLLSVNMVLMAGPHNGSTFAVLARDNIFDKVRELTVVGGTGSLRGVTGYGLLRTHTFNTTDGNAVLKIDMYLTV